MRCRLILLISDHPTQQGIRKGGVRHFCDEDGRTDRMAYSRQLDVSKTNLKKAFFSLKTKFQKKMIPDDLKQVLGPTIHDVR